MTLTILVYLNFGQFQIMILFSINFYCYYYNISLLISVVLNWYRYLCMNNCELCHCDISIPQHYHDCCSLGSFHFWFTDGCVTLVRPRSIYFCKCRNLSFFGEKYLLIFYLFRVPLFVHLICDVLLNMLIINITFWF